MMKNCLDMQADLRLCYLHYAIGTFVLINEAVVGGMAGPPMAGSLF